MAPEESPGNQKSRPQFEITLACLFSPFDSDDEKQPYESGLLKLNCDKALHYLHWQAILSFQETVRMTAEWYCSYYENHSTIRDVTLSHIREYESYTRDKEMRWAQ